MNIESHKFWDSDIKSELNFNLIVDSKIKSFNVSIFSLNPKIYQTSVIMSGGTSFSNYCNKNEAIKIIQNEWLKHYENSIDIEFIEHQEIDMFKYVKYKLNLSFSSPEISPRFLSPRGSKSTETSPRRFRQLSSRYPKSTETSPRNKI